MDRILRTSLIVLAVASQASAPVASPSAALSGVVVDAESGAPIANAEVTLGNSDRRTNIVLSSPTQLTDARGRFVFVDLPASGFYYLRAGKLGYTDDGNPGEGRGTFIALAQGEWFAEARVRLSRAASISGHVTDERGDPVVGVRVRSVAEIAIAGRRQLASGPIATTDDRGAYRIGGLRPGRYYVFVPTTMSTVPAGMSSAEIAGRSTTAGTGGSRPIPIEQALDLDPRGRLILGSTLVPPPPRDGRFYAYPLTFHGGGSSIERATPLTIATGEARGATDVRLDPFSTAAISGVVEGPSEAAGSVTLRLVASGLEELALGTEVATARTNPDGSFVFLNVPAGSYVIDLPSRFSEFLTHDSLFVDLPTWPGALGRSRSSEDVAAAPPGTTYTTYGVGGQTGAVGYFGQSKVTVDAADVTGVRVVLRPAGRISGRTVIEDNPTRDPAMQASRSVSAEPASARPSLGRPRNTAPRDGPENEFLLTGLGPGEYFLRIPAIAGWAIKSILHEGRDYTHAPFDAAAVQDFSGVVITVTDDVASLGGTVATDALTPADPPTVVVFPAEEAQWTNYGLNPVRIKSQAVSNRGAFLFDTLPAGDYLVVAVRSDDEVWRAPGFFSRVRAAAQRVPLAWGETKHVSLPVVDLRPGGGR